MGQHVEKAGLPRCEYGKSRLCRCIRRPLVIAKKVLSNANPVLAGCSTRTADSSQTQRILLQCGSVMETFQPQAPTLSIGMSPQHVVTPTGPTSIEQQSNRNSVGETPHATATSVRHHPSSNPAAVVELHMLRSMCEGLLKKVYKNPSAAADGLQDQWESVYRALQNTELWPVVPSGLTWRHVWVLNAAYYEFVLFQEFDKARQLLKDMLSNNNVIVVLFVTIVYTAAVNPANGVSALLGAQINSPGTGSSNTTSIQFTYDGFNPVSAIMLIMYTLGYALALMSIVGGIGVIFLVGPIWSFENFRDTNPMWGSLLHMSVLAFMFSMYVFLGAYGVSVWQLYAAPSFSVAVAVLVLVYSLTLLVQWTFVEVLTQKMSGLSARIARKQLKYQYLLKLAGKTWPQDMDTILQVVTGVAGMCRTLEWFKKDPLTCLDKFFDAFVFYRATVLHDPEGESENKSRENSRTQEEARAQFARLFPTMMSFRRARSRLFATMTSFRSAQSTTGPAPAPGETLSTSRSVISV